MSMSEIARIREQIELECQALANLKLFSAVASHRSISHRYENLDQHREQLSALVGEQEATKIVVDIYNEQVEKKAFTTPITFRSRATIKLLTDDVSGE